MSKLYALREWLKLELRKRKMRKVELLIKEDFKEGCVALTRAGQIIIDSSWIKNLDLILLIGFLKHELDHIQVFRLLRNSPRLERKIQDLLDRELVRKFERISKEVKKEIGK